MAPERFDVLQVGVPGHGREDRLGRGRPGFLVPGQPCDVGLTDVRPGDETFGMVTALLSAGSATVGGREGLAGDGGGRDHVEGVHPRRPGVRGHRDAHPQVGLVHPA